jgi:hypothetical protein
MFCLFIEIEIEVQLKVFFKYYCRVSNCDFEELCPINIIFLICFQLNHKENDNKDRSSDTTHKSQKQVDLLYTYKHRVGRVLSVSPVAGIGTPPTPLAAGECAPPPFGLGGRAHSLAAKGVGESQCQRGDIHCGALYI